MAKATGLLLLLRLACVHYSASSQPQTSYWYWEAAGSSRGSGLLLSVILRQLVAGSLQQPLLPWVTGPSLSPYVSQAALWASRMCVWSISGWNHCIQNLKFKHEFIHEMKWLQCEFIDVNIWKVGMCLVLYNIIFCYIANILLHNRNLFGYIAFNLMLYRICYITYAT